ncbi:VOC family protein [Rhodobacter sp. Har01]|uniref:VOC family protein n=1 Tax=Rhodobacter sp. Har01 TaxID=2883999 RepID=UPI001D094725|nr:VOC family protein [Rhodobacter sp. Har01]MCB6179641.1 VOC family protein [Rhodobacter sp. Har01]
MANRIALFSLLVPDYDEALAFFLRIGFECREDTDLGNGKRWVRIAPRGGETEILLARAVGSRQSAAIGEQGGGRVWLFLETSTFENDYQHMQAQGVKFESAPRNESYGRVAVWIDPWGNRWDLIEFANADRSGTIR